MGDATKSHHTCVWIATSPDEGVTQKMLRGFRDTNRAGTTMFSYHTGQNLPMHGNLSDTPEADSIAIITRTFAEWVNYYSIAAREYTHIEGAIYYTEARLRAHATNWPIFQQLPDRLNGGQIVFYDPRRYNKYKQAVARYANWLTSATFFDRKTKAWKDAHTRRHGAVHNYHPDEEEGAVALPDLPPIPPRYQRGRQAQMQEHPPQERIQEHEPPRQALAAPREMPFVPVEQGIPAVQREEVVHERDDPSGDDSEAEQDDRSVGDVNQGAEQEAGAIVQGARQQIAEYHDQHQHQEHERGGHRMIPVGDLQPDPHERQNHQHLHHQQQMRPNGNLDSAQVNVATGSHVDPHTGIKVNNAPTVSFKIPMKYAGDRRKIIAPVLTPAERAELKDKIIKGMNIADL